MKYASLFISAGLLVGCSFVNAFDDVTEEQGQGGAAASGGTSAGVGGVAGSGGVGAGGSGAGGSGAGGSGAGGSGAGGSGAGGSGAGGSGAGGSGAGGSGAGGSGASGGTAGTGGGSALGQACQENEDCNPGTDDRLGCVEATFGPPSGMCTRTCTEDAACGVEGLCVDGRCALSCEWGTSDTSKCLGRREYGCVPTRDGGGAYVPERSVCTARCRNHSDCPSFCDYQTGLCTTALAGADLGTTCSADSDCQGACRGGRCAQHCTVGDFEMGACGSGLSKPQAAACLGSVTPLGGAAPGLGDGLGECYQLCDCSSPCRGSTDICYNLSQLVTVPGGPVAYWGRAGVCFPASATVNADPLSCP